jgi:lysophospholipase L1-like esterase
MAAKRRPRYRSHQTEIRTMNPRIASLALIVAAVLAFPAQFAPAAEPLPAQLRLFGRWDRRAPDRAITVNSGSYVRARFDGTGVAATFDLTVNKPPLPTIAWQIDGGDWQEAEITAKVTLAENLPAGPHTLWLMARGMDEHQSRWSPPLVASLTFTGLEIAGGKLADPLPEWDKPKRTMEIIGDSITEGVLVHPKRDGKSTWCWQTDGRLAYSGQTAIKLNAEWRQVGFGAQGVTHGGSGGSAPAPAAFDFFYKDCPRDDWQPNLLVLNHGTNDGGVKSEKFRPVYAEYLAKIRKAYPKANIAALRPFNGAHAADIAAEVKALNDAGDANVFYVDTTGWLGKGDFTDGLHPNVQGGAKASDKLAEAAAKWVER